jgi:hypothetical protein
VACPRRTDRDLEKKLLQIKAYAGARKKEYPSCNERMLRALKKMTRAAQWWGLYARIGTNYSLKCTSGPKNVKSASCTDLSDINYYHGFMLFADAAATISDGQVSSQFNFKPDYHCLVLKSTGPAYPGSHHWVDHLWLNTDRMAITSDRNMLDNFTPAFTDIWVAGENGKGLDIFAGTAAHAAGPNVPVAVSDVHRTVKAHAGRSYEIADEWTIQTAPYEIDPVQGRVSPGSWTKIPGEAQQVQKVAMPGWALLASLTAKLT